MTLLLSDICAWFGGQRGATRLDTVVSLLQMLCPLELQFVGVCVDDLTRRDHHCLRDVEQRFNVPDMVARLTDLNDERCRASLVVAMSLLKATNYSTATTVYQILLSFYVVYKQLPRTKDVIDEIMLLLTMAKHHPAFKFEQKTSITGLFDDMIAFIHENQPATSAAAATSFASAEDTDAAYDQTLSDRQRAPCGGGGTVAATSVVQHDKFTQHTTRKDKSRLVKSKTADGSQTLSTSERRCVSTQTCYNVTDLPFPPPPPLPPNRTASATTSAGASTPSHTESDDTSQAATAAASGSLVVNTSGHESQECMVSHADFVNHPAPHQQHHSTATLDRRHRRHFVEDGNVSTETGSKHSTSSPASKSQSPAASLPNGFASPGLGSTPANLAAMVNGGAYRSPSINGGASLGACGQASVTPPPLSGAFFKQQQPIRCLMPMAAGAAASQTQPTATIFAQPTYAPNMPPPRVAYSLQGSAGAYPFFTAVLPPPAPFRFLCAPPPMPMPPLPPTPPTVAQPLLLCPHCSSMVSSPAAGLCHSCLMAKCQMQQQQRQPPPQPPPQPPLVDGP